MNAFLSKAVLVVLMVADLASCGSDDQGWAQGKASSADDGPTLAGQGTGVRAAKDLSRFVGAWRPTSGTFTLLCDGKTGTSPVASDTVWSAGLSSDLEQASGGCPVQANVVESTATGLPNQACFEGSGTAAETLTISAYTFSLGADGVTAVESASGTEVVGQAGATTSCTFSQSASYQKLAN